MNKENIEEFMLIDDEPDWVFTIRVPKLQKREGETYEDGTHVMGPKVIGVINEKMEDCGFAFRIDMSYKGKPDQWTSNFMELSAFYSVEEFEEICRQHGIDVAYE